MALDGVTSTVFRAAAIPGLTDTGTITTPAASGSSGGKNFPNLTPAQSAANIKAAGGTAATTGPNGSPLTGAAGGALDKNAFLKLLVSEMTNQDPMKPADNTQFVAQLAQFSTLEQMQNLNTGFTNLQSSFQEAQARGLLGTQIKSVNSSTGTATDGQVDKIILGSMAVSGGPPIATVQVDVNGTAVNLSDITSVGIASLTGSGSNSPLPGTVVPPSSPPQPTPSRP